MRLRIPFLFTSICVIGKARRPQGRVAASALQDNLGTDGPSGRTGNRAPRSRRQLHSLSECDAHREPADSPVSGEPSIDRDIHSSLGQHLFSQSFLSRLRLGSPPQPRSTSLGFCYAEIAQGKTPNSQTRDDALTRWVMHRGVVDLTCACGALAAPLTHLKLEIESPKFALAIVGSIPLRR